MNGLGLLIAVVAFAQVPGESPAPTDSPNIQFGWNLEADNKFAYILHVPPAAIETMLTSGDELESNMPVELVGLVSRVVVKISEVPPVRSHTLTQLGDLQKQAARERQSRLPGNALATLSGKTEDKFVEIDRNREADSTTNTAPSTISPPPFQSSVTAQPPVGAANPFGPRTGISDSLTDRNRQLPTDPSALPPSTNTPSTFANPNDFSGSSLAVGGSATSAQQPVVTSGGLPPSARNPGFPNNTGFPTTPANNSGLSGSPALNSTFPASGQVDAMRGDRDSFSNPINNAGAIPRSGSSFDQGFPTGANQNPSTANDLRLADNRVSIPNAPGSLTTPALQQSAQTQSSPGDSLPTRSAGTGVTTAPQRDKLLPILFMLSFVANVYMAILMSKLVGRYRTLLSSVRSSMAGYGDSLTA
jgi:hypothetical protein